MDDLASFKVMFKAPEDSSPRIPLREPEIIQTSISDEKFDSTNQDLVPDPKTIPEKKLTLFINNKVVPFFRISRDKVGLWLFYCWIFLVCLFCGLCVFGMLVFLVLQLSARCETYLSSHVQNTLGGSAEVLKVKIDNGAEACEHVLHLYTGKASTFGCFSQIGLCFDYGIFHLRDNEIGEEFMDNVFVKGRKLFALP
ncbi:hypothetical protein QYF36_006791 [Acer negundo]|nr:hypothetical protein QYF36_006791 [Acer negundo]